MLAVPRFANDHREGTGKSARTAEAFTKYPQSPQVIAPGRRRPWYTPATKIAPAAIHQALVAVLDAVRAWGPGSREFPEATGPGAPLAGPRNPPLPCHLLPARMARSSAAASVDHTKRDSTQPAVAPSTVSADTETTR
jgi:hypothetical protein